MEIVKNEKIEEYVYEREEDFSIIYINKDQKSELLRVRQFWLSGYEVLVDFEEGKVYLVE